MRTFIEVRGNIAGGSATLELAEMFLKEGKTETAYFLLERLDLDRILDQAKADVRKVDDAAVLEEIRKIDSSAWKDDFEATWKPLSEE